MLIYDNIYISCFGMLLIFFLQAVWFHEPYADEVHTMYQGQIDHKFCDLQKKN